MMPIVINFVSSEAPKLSRRFGRPLTNYILRVKFSVGELNIMSVDQKILYYEEYKAALK